MSRAPVMLTLALATIWLLLNGSLDPRQVALGVALAIALTLLASRLSPVRPRLRRPYLLLPLLVVVLGDVIRSNVAVARIILGLNGGRPVRPGFLDIPLDLRDPHGLALLAAIVTSTPGTAWAGVSADGGTLTLHVLDLQEESYWVRTIKDRYERQLLRVFQ